MSPNEFANKKILVVDDEERMVRFIRLNLEQDGFQVLEAFRGRKVLEIIRTQLPDLILLDVMMPRMSGFEVCRKLKEDQQTKTIPVMMVTALNELGDIERGVESGTDDFVTKPVNKLELLTRVKSLLRVRHLKRELDRTMAYIRDIEQRRGGVDEAR